MTRISTKRIKPALIDPESVNQTIIASKPITSKQIKPRQIKSRQIKSRQIKARSTKQAEVISDPNTSESITLKPIKQIEVKKRSTKVNSNKANLINANATANANVNAKTNANAKTKTKRIKAIKKINNNLYIPNFPIEKSVPPPDTPAIKGYNHIAKNMVMIYDKYDIPQKKRRILTQQDKFPVNSIKWATISNILDTLIYHGVDSHDNKYDDKYDDKYNNKYNESDENIQSDQDFLEAYHKCVIEQMLSILKYVYNNNVTEYIWEKILSYAKSNIIFSDRYNYDSQTTYDLIKLHNMTSYINTINDIILIFGHDAKNITKYVKTLRNSKIINNIITELASSELRLMFNVEDAIMIIFNNFNTIKKQQIDRLMPTPSFVDDIIKLISFYNDKSNINNNTIMSKKNTTLSKFINDNDDDDDDNTKENKKKFDYMICCVLMNGNSMCINNVIKKYNIQPNEKLLKLYITYNNDMSSDIINFFAQSSDLKYDTIMMCIQHCMNKRFKVSRNTNKFIQEYYLMYEREVISFTKEICNNMKPINIIRT